jgi:xanthine dehydrogenase YagR molybdenum-binding subunit
VGATEQGVIQAWDSHHWGTGGVTSGAVSQAQIPYVIAPKNFRRVATKISTNTANLRAWRAPNHPQACAMSQTALDDLAAKMGADSYDIFLRNLFLAQGAKPEVYAAEMEVGAKLIDWKAKWHPHGKGPKKGSVVEGLGMALHTWGGGGHDSSCTIKIYPDGGVETYCGSQDLGTGTRTVMALVVAETFGISPNAVRVTIGSSKLPVSGPSGGSTTVGGVSESHRRGSQDAFEKIAELVGKKLEVDPQKLEAVNGRIQVAGEPSKSVSWKEACGLLGKPLEVTGTFTRGKPSPLSSQQVGGVQMAHVAVDTETGVVKIRKFVAVQDQGLVINPKTCKSQIYGGVIMGIAAALYEQRVCDPKSGAFLNAELSDY